MPTPARDALSPDICGSKVILFLGAGASASLGLPVMGPFMDLLEQEIGDAGLMITLTNMYSGDPSSKDLEVIFERMGEYQSLAQHLKNDRNLQPLFHQGDLDKLMNRVARLRRLTERLILSTYASVDADKVVSLYNMFVHFLAFLEGTHRIVVFTTNYDTAMEDLVDAVTEEFELVDGFTPGSTRVWKPEIVFDLYQANALTHKTDLLLFKLHGSSSWYHRKSTDQIVKQGGMFVRLSGNPDYENTVVWPAQTKGVPSGPYETNYAYLQHCLNQAQLCVVVGFSFRDEEIRRHFTRAIAENHTLRLAVVDPDAETIMQKKLGIREGKRFKPFPSLFDEERVEGLLTALEHFAA
jgi:hypothetical protein